MSGPLVVGLLLLYAIVAPVVWALCRMSARQDAEEAQRALVALVPSRRRRRRRARAMAFEHERDLP